MNEPHEQYRQHVCSQLLTIRTHYISSSIQRDTMLNKRKEQKQKRGISINNWKL